MNRFLIQICENIKTVKMKVWLLILTGTLAWSLTMVKSGLMYQYGVGFWGPNGHDGVFHISLAKSLASGSWNMPMISGELIRNYHIGFDLLLAILHKVTFIPIETLYFQILPPILSLGIGLLVYFFVLTWRRSRSAAFWSTFFVYFSGSFGWIITYLRGFGFGGESLFWSQQSLSTLINPPYALSLVCIFTGLILLTRGLRENSKKYLMASTILFGLLIQIKVYAGLLVLGALFVAGLWRMLQRKGVSLMKVFSGSLILSILIFAPMNNMSASSVVYKPFWFLETMMSFPDRVGWQKFGEAMVNYRLGGVWTKGITAYMAAFVIFLVGNLGIRTIALVYIVKQVRNFNRIDYVDLMIFSIVGAGVIMPILFVQRGTAWNTIQFFYYSLVFMSVLTGIVFADFLSKLSQKKAETPGVELQYRSRSGILKQVVFLTIVLLTAPSVIATMRHYLPSRPPAMISTQELEALRFLSKQPDGVVLTQLFDQKAADKAVDNPPRPLYLYESTAYVSAYSGKPVYIEDEVNLEITGYGWRERREGAEKILGYKDIGILGDFIRENGITYIYWLKDRGDGEFWEDKGLEKVFGNGGINIYKVM
jgi:hypothetical protein